MAFILRELQPHLEERTKAFQLIAATLKIVFSIPKDV